MGSVGGHRDGSGVTTGGHAFSASAAARGGVHSGHAECARRPRRPLLGRGAISGAVVASGLTRTLAWPLLDAAAQRRGTLQAADLAGNLGT